MQPSWHLDYVRNAYQITRRVSQWKFAELQSILHAAARLVTGVRWNEHITPTLRDTLHWLPVWHRITYKIATMAFRCVRCACSAYVTDACIPVEAVAGRAKLRSARHGKLIVPLTRTKTFGSHSFRSAALTVWDSLPHYIRLSDVSRGQLASHLKTWLLSCASTWEALLRTFIVAPPYKTTD